MEIVAPERRLIGYTTKPLVCPFPDLPPMVGYARTVTIRSVLKSGLPADEQARRRIAYYEYVGTGFGPRITVIQDIDGADVGYGAFWGEVQSNVHKALGCLGVITDGSIRDIPQWAPGFQALAGSIGPSHAWVHAENFGGEVRVAGMTVKSDDLIHADQHGAIVIPTDIAAKIPDACELCGRRETPILEIARSQGLFAGEAERGAEAFGRNPLTQKSAHTAGGGRDENLVAALLLVVVALARSRRRRPIRRARITLVVPFPPGGSTDAAARIMAERMRVPLGQPIVIENVGGAGGSIGVGRVARAAPDGYTFDIGQWDTHVGSIIYKLDYDLEKDFEPIALVSNNPQLMVAKNDLPAKTLGELVTWMKANPGKINFVNQNAAANVTGVLFENLTKQKVQFIPYRGAGPAMTDLVSGTVDLLVVQGAVALPQIRAGKIKALANLSPQRSASMADIPTSDESGVPGLYMSGWFGFWAPKGTPKDIIAKLNAATVEALADPALQKRFTDLGLDVAPRAQQTPEGLAAFQKAEIDKWWPIIKSAGIGVQAQ